MCDSNVSCPGSQSYFDAVKMLGMYLIDFYRAKLNKMCVFTVIAS